MLKIVVPAEAAPQPDITSTPTTVVSTFTQPTEPPTEPPVNSNPWSCDFEDWNIDSGHNCRWQDVRDDGLLDWVASDKFIEDGGSGDYCSLF